MHTTFRLLGATALSTVLLPLGASSDAADRTATPPASPACVSPLPDNPRAAAERLSTLITRMQGAGLTQHSIDARLAERHCVKRVSPSTPEYATRSNPEDEITVHKPVIYQPNSKPLYIASASWKWKRIPSDVKGYDGMALRFSKKITDLGHSLSYQGNGSFYRKKTMRQAEETGSAGTSFIFNEGPRLFGGRDMQGYQGTLTIVFKPSKVGCWNLQAYSRYAHSWGSRSVTGFSVELGRGDGGFGISWANNKEGWKQSGQASRETRVCRKS